MWWHTRRKQISSLGETDESVQISGGASVQSTTGSRGVRIRGNNAGYTMFWSSVKSTGYSLHSPVSPTLHLPCVTVCHHVSTGLYHSAGVGLFWHIFLSFNVLCLSVFCTSFLVTQDIPSLWHLLPNSTQPVVQGFFSYRKIICNI